MELKQYLKIFKQYSPLIIAFSLLGAALAFVLTPRLPSGYTASQLFYVVSPKLAQNPSYNFEGYFIQEEARNFTDSAIAILSSADFTSELAGPNLSINARKAAPQVIRLSVTAETPENSRKLLTKAVSSFNQKMVDLTGDQAVRIKAVGPEMEATFAGFNQKIMMVFGFLIGAIFAILTVSLKTYFKV